MTERVRSESSYAQWLAALREARQRALEEAQREQALELQQPQQRAAAARADAYNAGAVPSVDLGSGGGQAVDPALARDIALATAATVMGRDPEYIERTFPPEAVAVLSEEVQTLLQAGATPDQAHQALVGALGSSPEAVQAMTVSLYQGAYGRSAPQFVTEQAQSWASLIDQQLGGSAQDVANYLGYQIDPGGGYNVPGFVTDESMRVEGLPQQQVPFVDPQVSATTTNTGAGANPSTGVPFFSQFDDRWKHDTLNEAVGATGGTNRDMQTAGCAVASAAMALSAATGRTITPADLDKLNPYGVDASGRESNGLAWPAIGMAEANWSMETILRELEAGRPVVVGVDSSLSDFQGSSDGATNHWVTLTGVQKDAQGRITGFTANDPGQTSGGQMTFSVQGGTLVGTSGPAQYTTTGKLRVVTGEPFQLATGETVRGAGSGRPLTLDAGNPDGTVTTTQAVTGKPMTQGQGVSLEQLLSIMPQADRAKAEKYLPYLNQAMQEFEIHSPERVAAFLAQLAHESGQLRYMEEIASGAAYEGRSDLGNTRPGDGTRYKGRGPIQLTGRSNYRTAGEALGLDLIGNPGIAASPEVGFRIAGWYWKTRELNAYADAGNFDTITKRINGGFNGKADRDQFYARALQVMGSGLAGNVPIAQGNHPPTAVSSSSGGGGVSAGGGSGGGGRTGDQAPVQASQGFATRESLIQNAVGAGSFFATLMKSLAEYGLWLEEEQGKNLARALADNPAFKQFVKQKTGKDLKPGEQPSPELVMEFLGQQLAGMDVSQGGPLELRALEAELGAGRGQPELKSAMGMLDAQLGLGLGLSELAAPAETQLGSGQA